MLCLRPKNGLRGGSEGAEERGGPWWGTQRRGVAGESLNAQVCLMPSFGELPHPTLLPSARGMEQQTDSEHSFVM